MEVSPNLDAVVALDVYREQHREEDADIQELAGQAQEFLKSFAWVDAVLNLHVGAVFPGIIGIFLAHIRPTRAGVDDWMWVIVGDLPPAFINCEFANVPWEALDGYIGELDAWVAAARAGESVDDLMPVNASATPDYADQLDRRLKFLDDRIMPALRSDHPSGV